MPQGLIPLEHLGEVREYRLAIETGDNTGRAIIQARELLEHPLNGPEITECAGTVCPECKFRPLPLSSFRVCEAVPRTSWQPSQTSRAAPLRSISRPEIQVRIFLAQVMLSPLFSTHLTPWGATNGFNR